MIEHQQKIERKPKDANVIRCTGALLCTPELTPVPFTSFKAQLYFRKLMGALSSTFQLVYWFTNFCRESAALLKSPAYHWKIWLNFTPPEPSGPGFLVGLPSHAVVASVSWDTNLSPSKANVCKSGHDSEAQTKQEWTRPCTPATAERLFLTLSCSRLSRLTFSPPTVPNFSFHMLPPGIRALSCNTESDGLKCTMIAIIKALYALQ